MYGVPYAMFLLDFKNVGGLFGEEVADVFLGSDLMAFSASLWKKSYYLIPSK